MARASDDEGRSAATNTSTVESETTPNVVAIPARLLPAQRATKKTTAYWTARTAREPAYASVVVRNESEA